MLIRLVLVFALLLSGPALGQDRALLDQALARAIATFEAAKPSLGTSAFGVEIGAYQQALTRQRFESDTWGGAISVDLVIRTTPDGSCQRFAAFARIPPENSAVRLVLCPQFFLPGANSLRTLTMLHEMVHVVAGADECRAMAFAARVEQAANGRFTPVDEYWKASGCSTSRFKLPTR